MAIEKLTASVLNLMVPACDARKKANLRAGGKRQPRHVDRFKHVCGSIQTRVPLDSHLTPSGGVYLKTWLRRPIGTSSGAHGARVLLLWFPRYWLQVVCAWIQTNPILPLFADDSAGTKRFTPIRVVSHLRSAPFRVLARLCRSR